MLSATASAPLKASIVAPGRLLLVVPWPLPPYRRAVAFRLKTPILNVDHKNIGQKTGMNRPRAGNEVTLTEVISVFWAECPT